jgi:hypothetical protein
MLPGWGAWQDGGVPPFKLVAQVIEHRGILFSEIGLCSDSFLSAFIRGGIFFYSFLLTAHRSLLTVDGLLIPSVFAICS